MSSNERCLLETSDDVPSFKKVTLGPGPRPEDPTYDGAIRQGLFDRRSQVGTGASVAVHHSLLSQLSFQLLLAQRSGAKIPRSQEDVMVTVMVPPNRNQRLICLTPQNKTAWGLLIRA